jgi:hypothetical protein
MNDLVMRAAFALMPPVTLFDGHGTMSARFPGTLACSGVQRRGVGTVWRSAIIEAEDDLEDLDTINRAFLVCCNHKRFHRQSVDCVKFAWRGFECVGVGCFLPVVNYRIDTSFTSMASKHAHSRFHGDGMVSQTKYSYV